MIDGDTGWLSGHKWRLITRNGGIDAPEVSSPGCAAEKVVGEQATRRLRDLTRGGYTLSGDQYDRYGRRLMVMTLADGRDAGEVLIGEGLAQPWPNTGNRWCGY